MHARRALPTGSETEKAVRGLLMPCLEIEGGAVVVATANGRVSARDSQGRLFDILDESDQLAEKYGRLYLIDHDGRDHDHPQLDYLQEIARTAEVWVDSGVRTSDQAIDVVVAGAFRTVLSTAYLRGESELRQ
ncbi:MAG TPA: HisA/HisF-related TIM barrel protein, partial [Thermoplasmata archaeon]|nr:HisA/HisF-related TIM barrel protein [Thermoplasmata archaeon]